MYKIMTSIALTVLVSSCVSAPVNPYNGPPMERAGFREMVASGRYQVQNTNIDATKTEKEKMDDAIFVEHYLRRNVTYANDCAQYKTTEYWAVMDDDFLHGDCEDSALTARKMLFDMGWSHEDVFILKGQRVRRDGTVSGHSILAIVIDGKTLAIANGIKGIKPPSKKYKWKLRTSEDKLIPFETI